LSVNEVCFAAEHADRYYLYRIYDFDESANRGSLFIQRGALENAFDLTAIQFRVRSTAHDIPAVELLDGGLLAVRVPGYSAPEEIMADWQRHKVRGDAARRLGV
jgi:hypothetical protein